jgi:hypothetical protein
MARLVNVDVDLFEVSLTLDGFRDNDRASFGRKLDSAITEERNNLALLEQLVPHNPRLILASERITFIVNVLQKHYAFRMGEIWKCSTETTTLQAIQEAKIVVDALKSKQMPLPPNQEEHPERPVDYSEIFEFYVTQLMRSRVLLQEISERYDDDVPLVIRKAETRTDFVITCMMEHYRINKGTSYPSLRSSMVQQQTWLSYEPIREAITIYDTLARAMFLQDDTQKELPPSSPVDGRKEVLIMNQHRN